MSAVSGPVATAPAVPHATAGRHWIITALLAVSDAVAALLLVADLLVVCV